MSNKSKTWEEYAAEEPAYAATLKNYAKGLGVSNEEFEAFSDSKKIVLLSDFILRNYRSVKRLLLDGKKDFTLVYSEMKDDDPRKVHKHGEFYSWNVINETTMIKKGDKSFFEHKGSGVPKEVKWFFDAVNMQHGNRKDITLLYEDKEYAGRIEIDPMQRCRIFWHTDLGNKFKTYYREDNGEYPLIRFQKIENGRYEVEFLDSVIIEEEKDNPFETIAPAKEGKKKEYYVSKYERKPVNRKLAIQIHGTKCMVCGFDFEAVYGEAGRNFIEVHHTKPLSDIGEEVEINPETDLVCVCSNCHRIIHRKKDGVYTLEEVKNMLSICLKMQ